MGTYLEQLSRIGALLCVDLERLGEVILEDERESVGIGNLGGAIGGNEIECLEGVLIQIGGFALDHFCQGSVVNGREKRRTNGHDAKTPDIDLWTVLFSSDDLWGHPIGSADHGCALRMGGIGNLGAKAKVG